jgi:hypothetical protein
MASGFSPHSLFPDFLIFSEYIEWHQASNGDLHKINFTSSFCYSFLSPSTWSNKAVLAKEFCLQRLDSGFTFGSSESIYSIVPAEWDWDKQTQRLSLPVRTRPLATDFPLLFAGFAFVYPQTSFPASKLISHVFRLTLPQQDDGPQSFKPEFRCFSRFAIIWLDRKGEKSYFCAFTFGFCAEITCYFQRLLKCFPKEIYSIRMTKTRTNSINSLAQTPENDNLLISNKVWFGLHSIYKFNLMFLTLSAVQQGGIW